MRVGFGYDVHRLVGGRRLVLGGVDVPYERGLLGHSDADVLMHAIIDAVIGAAALGDIGGHFPASNGAYKDIASTELLKKAAALLTEKGFRIVNIDSTIVCEAPRLSPYTCAMAECISRSIGLTNDSVNVKAKTEEGLGFTGSGEGISAYAVVLIETIVEARDRL